MDFQPSHTPSQKRDASVQIALPNITPFDKLFLDDAIRQAMTHPARIDALGVERTTHRVLSGAARPTSWA